MNTIPTPISPREVDEKTVVPFLNKELRPFLREARDAANAEYHSTRTVSTAATGTYTNIWTSDSMPTDSAWDVRCVVLARATAGAAQRASYEICGLFYNVAGTVSQQGTSTLTYEEESAAGMNVRLQVSGQTVQLDVLDDGISTIAWVARIHILRSEEV